MPKKDGKTKPKKPNKKAKPAASPPYNGLVASWPFYEGVGAAAHDVSQYVHPTHGLTGDLELITVGGSGEWVEGDRGVGYDPNESDYWRWNCGTSGVVNIGPGVDFYCVVGLEAPASIPAAGERIFSKQDVNVLGSFVNGYTLSVNPATGFLDFYLEQSGGSLGRVTTNENFCDGKFHAVLAGREGSTGYIVVDGIKPWTDTVPSGSLSCVDPFMVGYIDYYGQPYSAPIYFVNFYLGPRPDDRVIREFYTSPWVPFAPVDLTSLLVGSGIVGVGTARRNFLALDRGLRLLK